jgi:hypothetical protein
MNGLLSNSRGQSAVIGAIMVLAVAMLGISIVLLSGVQAVDDSRQNANARAAETELTSFSGTAESVAFDGGVQEASMDLNLDGGKEVMVRPQTGHMTVTVGGNTQYNGDLGAIQLESGELTLGYQSGGVFRSTADGGSDVSRAPSVTMRGSPPTLTLPIIEVRGQGSLGENVIVRRQATDNQYPDKYVPAGETVVIVISGPYAAAWTQFFAESVGVSDSQLSYDDSTETLTVTLGSGSEMYLHLHRYTVVVDDG